jgi:hypothetical protein
MRWCLCHKSWYKPPLQHGLGQLCLAPARVIGPTDAGSGASCTRHDPSGRVQKLERWAALTCMSRVYLIIYRPFLQSEDAIDATSSHFLEGK